MIFIAQPVALCVREGDEVTKWLLQPETFGGDEAHSCIPVPVIFTGRLFVGPNSVAFSRIQSQNFR
jgi:hypothetical protein